MPKNKKRRSTGIALGDYVETVEQLNRLTEDLTSKTARAGIERLANSLTVYKKEFQGLPREEATRLAEIVMIVTLTEMYRGHDRKESRNGEPFNLQDSRNPFDSMENTLFSQIMPKYDELKSLIADTALAQTSHMNQANINLEDIQQIALFNILQANSRRYTQDPLKLVDKAVTSAVRDETRSPTADVPLPTQDSLDQFQAEAESRKVSSTALLQIIAIIQRMDQAADKVARIEDRIASLDKVVLTSGRMQTLESLQAQLVTMKIELNKDAEYLQENRTSISQHKDASRKLNANLQRINASETQINNLTGNLQEQKITPPKAAPPPHTVKPSQEAINQLRNFRFTQTPTTAKPTPGTPPSPPAAPAAPKAEAAAPPPLMSKLRGVAMHRSPVTPPPAVKAETIITPKPQAPAPPETPVRNQVYFTQAPPVAKRPIKLGKLSTGKTEVHTSNVDVTPTSEVKEPAAPPVAPAAPTAAASVEPIPEAPKITTPSSPTAAAAEEKKIDAAASAKPIPEVPPLILPETSATPTSSKRRISIEGREARRAKEQNAAKPDANTEFVIQSKQAPSAATLEKNNATVTQQPRGKIKLASLPQGTVKRQSISGDSPSAETKAQTTPAAPAAPTAEVKSPATDAIPDAPPLSATYGTTTSKAKGVFVPPKIEAIERRGSVIGPKIESAGTAEARMYAVLRQLNQLQEKSFDQISENEVINIRSAAAQAIEAGRTHGFTALENSISTGLTSLDQKMVAGIEAREAAEQAAEIQDQPPLTFETGAAPASQTYTGTVTPNPASEIKSGQTPEPSIFTSSIEAEPEIKIETGTAPDATTYTGKLTPEVKSTYTEMNQVVEPVLSVSTIGSLDEEKLEAIAKDSSALTTDLENLQASTKAADRPAPEVIAAQLAIIEQRFQQVEAALTKITPEVNTVAIITEIGLAHDNIRDVIENFAQAEATYIATLHNEDEDFEAEVVITPLPDEEKKPEVNRLAGISLEIFELNRISANEIELLTQNVNKVIANLSAPDIASSMTEFMTQRTPFFVTISQMDSLVSQFKNLTSSIQADINAGEKELLPMEQVGTTVIENLRNTLEGAEIVILREFAKQSNEIANNALNPPADFVWTQEIIDAQNARIDSMRGGLLTFQSTITDPLTMDTINEIKANLDRAAEILTNQAAQLLNPNATPIPRIREINELLKNLTVTIEANSLAIEKIEASDLVIDRETPESIKKASSEYVSRIATINSAKTDYQALMNELASLQSSAAPQSIETKIISDWTPEKMSGLFENANASIKSGGHIILDGFYQYSLVTRHASESPDGFTKNDLDKVIGEIDLILTRLAEHEKIYNQEPGVYAITREQLEKAREDYKKAPLETPDNTEGKDKDADKVPKNEGGETDTETQTQEDENTTDNTEKAAPKKEILRKLTAEQEKQPPNPYIGLPNDYFKAAADRILNSKDLNRSTTLLEYFDQKINEAHDPNATNLGRREKLISDWNDKIFPLLERVNTRRQDLTNILYVLKQDSINPDQSRIDTAKKALSEMNELYDKLYAPTAPDGTPGGVRSIIQEGIDKYGLESIRIHAHTMAVVTRKEGQTADEFQAEIKRQCDTLRSEDKKTSDSFTMEEKDFKVNLSTQAAVVMVPGTPAAPGSYVATNLSYLLEKENTATVYSVQPGKISVHHLRADLKLNDMLGMSAIQAGLAERLPNPKATSRVEDILQLLSGYKEVPFSQKGLQSFLEVKVKTGEIQLPKPIAGMPRIGPTCRSMASEIYGNYIKIVRDPKNPQLPAPHTIELALALIRDRINSTNGTGKIPVNNSQNPEINRTVQLICEVMKRNVKTTAERYKFNYEAVGINNHEDYSRRFYQSDLIGAMQKALMKADPNFVEHLNVTSVAVVQGEKNRIVQNATFNLATTENLSRVPTQTATSSEETPERPSPRMGRGGSGD